jgi:hypothetical protein
VLSEVPVPLSHDPERRAAQLANLRRGRSPAPSPLDEVRGVGTARVPAPSPPPPETQADHPTLRKGSLPGTGGGNGNAVRNGLRTKQPGARFVEPIVAELREAAAETIGYTAADDPALRAVAVQLLIVERSAAFLAEHGTVDPETGKLRPELPAIGQAAERALRMLGDVGLTMGGRSKLGLDVARARLAAAAEADMAAGRRLAAQLGEGSADA